MGLLSLLFSDPLLFILLVPLLLYSVILHEVAHGYVAYLFGDETAWEEGRLTLNPASHIDPLGLLMLFVAGFGWAVPVPINLWRLRNRLGVAAVAMAGCAMNILIAIISLALLQFDAVNSSYIFSAVLPLLARINIILGAFNLIPLPPLDGSKILMSFLSWEDQQKLSAIEPYGFYILIFLLFTGLLSPLIRFMQNMIYGLISLIFGLFT